MNTQMLVPTRIRCGFKKREDTYTKMLAYVIYYDGKGVLRKKTSWEDWRDKKIEPREYDNVPTEGFVLNRGVGGVRHSYGWNTRNEYVRVWDPRDFEFEISVTNLLHILEHCNAIKGKGLEGKFVYAWSGTSLVLLSVDSPEYKECVNYTGLQTQKVPAKSLVPGRTYVTKKNDSLVYLGRFDWYELKDPKYYGLHAGAGKVALSYVFQKTDEKKRFVPLTSLGSLAKEAGPEIDEEYANRLEAFRSSFWGSPVVGLESGPSAPPNIGVDKQGWFVDMEDGRYARVEFQRKDADNTPYITGVFVSVKNGVFDVTEAKTCADPRSNYYGYRTIMYTPTDKTPCRLRVRLASGSVFEHGDYYFKTERVNDESENGTRTGDGPDGRPGDAGDDGAGTGTEGGDTQPGTAALCHDDDVLAQ